MPASPRRKGGSGAAFGWLLAELAPQGVVTGLALVAGAARHEAADLVEAQLARAPSGGGSLDILRRPTSMFDYRIEDFVVENYTPHPPIQAPVAV